MRTSNESLTAQENGNSGNFGGFDHYLCPADTPYPYNPKQYIADMAESEMNNRDGPWMIWCFSLQTQSHIIEIRIVGN